MNQILNCENYKNYLLAVMDHAKLASGKKQIQCRCKECSDSMNMSSAHMYISIPWDGDIPSLYHCFKCNASGIVTYKKLIEWGIYDDEIALQLINHMKGIQKSGLYAKYFDRDVYTLYNKYIH